jgi:hypothetical protein
MSEANKTFVTVLKKTLKYCKNGTLIILLNALMSSHAYAISSHDKDIYRLYAHTQIIVYKEFQCFDTLIMRESGYNPKAVNGSHYGLVQGDSTYLRKVDAFRQIDWGIQYVNHRYHGSWCNGLAHSNKFGWY